MINEQGSKTQIIEYNRSSKLSSPSTLTSSPLTSSLRSPTTLSSNHSHPFLKQKNTSTPPAIRLRSPRTKSQRNKITLEEWYKLPEYVQIRIPCPVLLQDIVTPSSLTNRIKNYLEHEVLLKPQNGTNIHDNTNDIIPLSRFVARKKASPKKDILPSTRKPRRWKCTNQSRAVGKRYTKNDIKLLDTLSPRKANV